MITNRQKGSSEGGTLSAIFYLVFMLIFLGRGLLVDDIKPVEAALRIHNIAEYVINDKDVWFVGFRGCQVDEAAKFEVTVTNKEGNTVDILVCTGWPFKGSTIRNEW